MYGWWYETLRFGRRSSKSGSGKVEIVAELKFALQRCFALCVPVACGPRAQEEGPNAIAEGAGIIAGTVHLKTP